MASLNKPFEQFVAKLPRSGHEIGRDFKFTSSTGMILPVWQHVLNPGDRINFSATMQTLTQPLQRPAMCDVHQKIELFFVPFTKLYTAFGQVMYQTRDYITSATNYSNGQMTLGNFFLPPDWSNFGWPETARQFALTAIGNQYSSSFFDSLYKGRFRLMMHLGYNPLYCFNSFFLPSGLVTDEQQQINTGVYDQPRVIPWMAAAYQCIYQDYYRDDDREERNLLSYQLDYMAGGGINSSILQLRYHQRKRDYFTSLRVSPIMSDLNLLDRYTGNEDGSIFKTLNKVNNYLDNNLVNPFEDDSAVGYDFNQNFTQYGLIQNYGDQLSTGALRSLFAVEKLNRITGRARKNYDSQVLAHLGVKVPRDIKHDLTFIGSLDGNMSIETILSTSAAAEDTDKGFLGLELGERAGSGNGKLGGRTLDFTAPCHGIVMAVYYSVPNQSYPLAGMFDKLNVLNNRLDFPQPEFDRLGDQPLFGFEAFTPQLDTNYGVFIKNSLMLGWQRRYEQFKRKPNVHSLAFYRPYNFTSESTILETNNNWSPWVLGRNPFDILETDNNAYDLRSFQQPAFTSFMSSPCDLNDIFVQKYNTGVPWELKSADDSAGVQQDTFTLWRNPWLLFQTDPFMHDLKINCKLVSFMSVTGEPELD